MGASEIVNISKNGDGIFEINIKVATDSVFSHLKDLGKILKRPTKVKKGKTKAEYIRT